MNILYNILAVLFSLMVGYLLGSIPSSVWIGKAFSTKILVITVPEMPVARMLEDYGERKSVY